MFGRSHVDDVSRESAAHAAVACCAFMVTWLMKLPYGELEVRIVEVVRQRPPDGHV